MFFVCECAVKMATHSFTTWYGKNEGRVGATTASPAAAPSLTRERGRSAPTAYASPSVRCAHTTSQGGSKAPLHPCQKNWDGTAKAKEADVGVALVKEVEKRGAVVDVLVMHHFCIVLIVTYCLNIK